MSITLTETLETLHCCKCGMLFAMPADYDSRRRNDHETFYCPAGHPQSYTGKSEADRLREELTREKHRAEQAQARAADLHQQREMMKRRLSATQGVVTRHKKKIAAGKCPCCSAQFKDLKSHMQNRHPNWDPAKEAEVRS